MRVLSIDGGGVRVAAAVSVLAELEKELLPNETILDKFDVFTGTSAGALVIAALVYAKMTAAQIRDQIFSVTNLHRIMPPSMRDILFGIVQVEPEYDGMGKRELLDEHFAPDQFIQDTDKKVIITWTDIDYDKPRLCLSWDEKSGGEFLVRDILDATSAAPGYFPFVEFKGRSGREYRGVDGALFANDPTDIAVMKVIEDFGNPGEIKVLSLGTGTVPGHWDGKKIHKKAGGIPWLVTGNLMNLIFDTPREMVKYRMKEMAKIHGLVYCRVTGNVDDSAMDNTKESNINSLKTKGREWWEKEKKNVLNEIILKETNLSKNKE